MTRLRRFLIPLIFALGLTGAVATTAQAAPKANPNTYTVTRTFGPYNGQAHWSNDLPGQLPDGEALWVACDPFDALRSKSMVVKRLSGQKALRLDSKGVEFSTYEPDDRWMFYAWFSPTGQPGWSSVTMSVTCKDTAAPYRG
jgi:hypothetical protein